MWVRNIVSSITYIQATDADRQNKGTKRWWWRVLLYDFLWSTLVFCRSLFTWKKVKKRNHFCDTTHESLNSIYYFEIFTSKLFWSLLFSWCSLLSLSIWKTGGVWVFHVSFHYYHLCVSLLISFLSFLSRSKWIISNKVALLDQKKTSHHRLVKKVIIIRGRRRHHVERVAVGVHGKHAKTEFGRFEERSGGVCRRGGVVVVFPRRRLTARRWERRPLWGEDVRETERSCVVGKSIVVVVAEYYS